MKNLLLVNTARLGNGASRKVAEIEACIAQLGVQCDIWPSPSPADVDETIARALAQGYTTILAGGGDGTVSSVGKRLVGKTDITFGILPLGTGNGIARHYGIPTRLPDALALLRNQQTVLTDVGLLDGEPFLGFCGFGLDAKVAHDFAGARKRNFLKYAWLSLRNFYRQDKAHFQIDINGQQLRWNPTVLTVCNTSQYGHGAIMAATATTEDGKLDLVGAWLNSLFSFLYLAWLMMRGKLDSSRHYQRIQATEMRILRPAPGPAQLDGEPWWTEQQVVLTCRPASLRMLVPTK